MPLGLLLYDFQYLDTASVRLGLLRLGSDSLLEDVPSRSRSPFISTQVFVASPLKEHISGSNVSFSYQPSLFFYNKANIYTHLSVSVDGSPYQTTGIATPKIFIVLVGEKKQYLFQPDRLDATDLTYPIIPYPFRPILYPIHNYYP